MAEHNDTILDDHILNIVDNYKIAEQIDLQKRLEGFGYQIPQATLSRKLKKLNIAKVAGVYKQIDFNRRHLPIILNLKVSEFGIIVLHTYPGQASGLAYFLDQTYVSYSPTYETNSGILGTIAGDDTVILIAQSKDDVKTAVRTIEEKFPYLKCSD